MVVEHAATIARPVGSPHGAPTQQLIGKILCIVEECTYDARKLDNELARLREENARLRVPSTNEFLLKHVTPDALHQAGPPSFRAYGEEDVEAVRKPVAMGAEPPHVAPPTMGWTTPQGRACMQDVGEEDDDSDKSSNDSHGIVREKPRNKVKYDSQVSAADYQKINSAVRQSLVMIQDEDEDPRKGALFTTPEAIKEMVRKACLMEADHDVTTFYHETGLMQRIARHSAFEQATLMVVAFNALWIAYDTDNNDADILIEADAQYFIVENILCLYFFIELVIRFGAFKIKSTCRLDQWFMFDLFLVVLMVMETWCLNLWIYVTGLSPGGDVGFLMPIKLLRLARMARMAKLMRALPELLILVKGIVIATRTVLFTLLLLLLIIYVYSVLLTQLCKEGSLADDFGTVNKSIVTLLIAGAFPDLGDLLGRVLSESFLYWIILLSFVLLASLTVMNMLVGILVEIISSVSAAETEQIHVALLKAEFKQILEMGVDADGNNKISREEFTALLSNAKACKALQNVGVDVLGLVDFIDFMFVEEDELEYQDFMEAVLELRGSNTATVKDIVDQRKWQTAQFSHLMERLESLTNVNTQRLTFARKNSLDPTDAFPPKQQQNASFTSNFAIEPVNSKKNRQQHSAPAPRTQSPHAPAAWASSETNALALTSHPFRMPY